MNEVDSILEDVHRVFYQELLAFVRGRVASEQDAEDIVQDVFVRMHTRRSELTEIENLGSWVYRVARNATVDHHRKRAAERRSAQRLSQGYVREEEQEGDDAATLLSTCIRQFVQELPRDARVALTLTDLDGMSQKEAAALVGISVSGMKSRVQRGREKVKKLLLGCCDIEVDARKRVIECTQHRADDPSDEG